MWQVVEDVCRRDERGYAQNAEERGLRTSGRGVEGEDVGERAEEADGCECRLVLCVAGVILGLESVD